MSATILTRILPTLLENDGRREDMKRICAERGMAQKSSTRRKGGRIAGTGNAPASIGWEWTSLTALAFTDAHRRQHKWEVAERWAEEKSSLHSHPDRSTSLHITPHHSTVTTPKSSLHITPQSLHIDPSVGRSLHSRPDIEVTEEVRRKTPVHEGRRE